MPSPETEVSPHLRGQPKRQPAANLDRSRSQLTQSRAVQGLLVASKTGQGRAMEQDWSRNQIQPAKNVQKKNVTCKYWKQGNCRKGLQCEYQHQNTPQNRQAYNEQANSNQGGRSRSQLHPSRPAQGRGASSLINREWNLANSGGQGGARGQDRSRNQWRDGSGDLDEVMGRLSEILSTHKTYDQ